MVRVLYSIIVPNDLRDDSTLSSSRLDKAFTSTATSTSMSHEMDFNPIPHDVCVCARPSGS